MTFAFPHAYASSAAAPSAQKYTNPLSRIRRKPPPSFEYSERYPPPDPLDPFAPLSVLRSRTSSAAIGSLHGISPSQTCPDVRQRSSFDLYPSPSVSQNAPTFLSGPIHPYREHCYASETEVASLKAKPKLKPPPRKEGHYRRRSQSVNTGSYPSSPVEHHYRSPFQTRTPASSSPPPLVSDATNSISDNSTVDSDHHGYSQLGFGTSVGAIFPSARSPSPSPSKSSSKLARLLNPRRSFLSLSRNSTPSPTPTKRIKKVSISAPLPQSLPVNNHSNPRIVPKSQSLQRVTKNSISSPIPKPLRADDFANPRAVPKSQSLYSMAISTLPSRPSRAETPTTQAPRSASSPFSSIIHHVDAKSAVSASFSCVTITSSPLSNVHSELGHHSQPEKPSLTSPNPKRPHSARQQSYDTAASSIQVPFPVPTPHNPTAVDPVHTPLTRSSQSSYVYVPSRPASRRSSFTAPSHELDARATPGSHPHEAFSSSDLPTPAQLVHAASLFVIAENGLRVAFGSLWNNKKCIVCFIRHFWCPLCQDYMFSISRNVDPEVLRQAGVELIIISNGSYNMIKSYRQIFRTPFALYTDPTLELYAALGMAPYATHSAPSPARSPSRAFSHSQSPPLSPSPSLAAPSYVQHGVIGGITRVVLRAVRVGMPVWEKGGAIGQLGGEFVLGPGMRCTWAHRMADARGHMPIGEVLERAGVYGGEAGESVSEPAMMGVGKDRCAGHGAAAATVRASLQSLSQMTDVEEKEWMDSRRRSLARLRDEDEAFRRASGDAFTDVGCEDECGVDEASVIVEEAEEAEEVGCTEGDSTDAKEDFGMEGDGVLSVGQGRSQLESGEEESSIADSEISVVKEEKGRPGDALVWPVVEEDPTTAGHDGHDRDE